MPQRQCGCLCNHILDQRCDLDLWAPESSLVITRG